MWSKNKSIRLKFSNKITFLTGFNGSGKSTILDFIYSSLQEGDSPNLGGSDWSTKSELEGNITIYNASLNANFDAKDKSFEDNIIKVNKALKTQSYSAQRFKKEITAEINAKTNKSTNLNNVTLSKESQDKIKKRYLVRLIKAPSSSEIYGKKVDAVLSPVLFKDEKFRTPSRPYATTEENQTEVEKNKAINKTLKELLIDFLGYENDINKENNIKAVNETDNILKNLEKALLESDKSSSNINLIREVVTDVVRKQHINDSESLSEIRRFEEKLELFFKCTGKTISRDDRNFLALKNADNDLITWNNLSKGEKNLLGLFLLAFLSNDKKTIFILDEPDLSLHIEWQKILISTLSEIAHESQFIIATHSPAMFLNECDFDVINMEDVML